MKEPFMLRYCLGFFVLTLGVSAVEACSLCEGGMINRSPTFRQEAKLAMARVIVHGEIANPTTSGTGLTGQTDFLIKTTLRNDPEMKGKVKLVLPRYLPINDKKKPPQYLLFCDIDKNKIDPYRGILVQSASTVTYVKKALALDPKAAVANLVFFFGYLDDADPEVSKDAFYEFAGANDTDLAKAAPKLDPAKLRKWIEDPKTPAARVGVYALLLGACGKDGDIELLRKLLDSKEERYVAAADGLLAGYMQKKPAEGWKLLQATLADGRKPLLLRLAVLRALRFYHGSQPKESRPHLLVIMKTLIDQGELADIAIEDLRLWQIWDLTADVLKLHGRKGVDSPLMQKAIIRYALCATPTKESRDFLAKCRKDDPETVQDVEEGLKFEKKK
jgi:hypothetical protein